MLKAFLAIFFSHVAINCIQSASVEYYDDTEYFTCKNGYTIPDYKVCNGHKDCSDGSDEYEGSNIIGSPCLEVSCPHSGAQCYYGACIPHTSWCNGINDCADKSDEWKYFCSKSENPNEVSCESGEFIAKHLFCDGKMDCEDGSDESCLLCSLRKCAAQQFRCRYGGCIDMQQKCNGVKNCHDGSDEDGFHAGCQPLLSAIANRTAASSLTPTAESQGCRITYDPNHDIRNENENVHIESGYVVPYNTRIAIKCNNNFSLWASGAEVMRLCSENGWNKEIPLCYKFCDANILKRSSSTIVNCKYRTSPVECERIRPNMVAEVSCANSYTMPKKWSRDATITMRCTETFAWDRRKINCEPICGQTEEILDPTASGAPWHVGVYAQSIEACGGTIISPRLVISAFHCVFDENMDVLSPNFVQVVAAGDLIDGLRTTIIKNISKIYADTSNDYDVALLKLSTPFTLSKNIRPICITLPASSYASYIQTDQIGLLHGWPRYKGRSAKDALFVKTQVKTIARSDCSSNLREDQFCVRPTDRMLKDAARTGPLCQGDSGGGIIVYHDNKYYLIGILSYKPSHSFICTTEPVVVSNFMKMPEMLRNVIDNDVESLYEDD